MSARYEVALYDTAYNQVAIFASNDILNLQYEKSVDTMGTINITIDGHDSRRSLFVTDAIIEVNRWDQSAGIVKYNDWRGLIRSPGRQLDQSDKYTAKYTGRDFIDLIHRVHILYENETIYADKTLPGDDAAKSYVQQNCGISATAPPRLIDGVLANFNVAANAGAAPVGTFTQSNRNLYDAVREIALAMGFDFDVVWTGVEGTPSWEFRTYYPQIGTDRTAPTYGPFVFSPDLGNMIIPNYEKNRDEEANVIIVQGQGSGANRQTYVYQTSAVNDSPFNRIETVQSERQEDQATGLVSTALYWANHLQAQESLTFDVQQTSTSMYGRDYFLGDKIVAKFDDIQSDLRILKTDVQVQQGRETIKIDIGTLVQ